MYVAVKGGEKAIAFPPISFRRACAVARMISRN